MIHRFSNYLVLMLCLLASGVYAEEAPDAYEVIQSTTDRVMKIVSSAQSYAEQDSERYYGELQVVLDEVVDFRGFARGVMGPYASKSRYDSLNKAGKKQMRSQAERFTQTMRRGLVRTYGKGLLAFGGSRVEVQRPPNQADSRKATITQLIYNDTPEPYVILYQMRRSRSNQWRLRNLIVEQINLGQIYKNQFQASARDYEGNLDAVIDNWTTSDEQPD